jgi:uncharacterized lipoprotein NlpE involved in copper resistance
MKKLFIVAVAIWMMYGCGVGSPKGLAGQTGQSEEMLGDGHNARNSLDYMGIYTGTLPTASGSGMIVTLTLGDSSYVKTIEYVGEKGIFEDRGAYSWKDDGSTIVLDGITDSPNSYFVAENHIVQLDMDGNRIEGDMADLYILRKKIEE